MGLLREQCAELRKGHLRYCCNQVWTKKGECNTYLRNIQDLLSDVKTPYERPFGVPFNGPVVPIGAMVEYHLISAKDLSRLHQFGTSLPRYIPWICVVRGVNLEKRHIGRRDIEELEQMDASEIYAKRLNAKEMSTPMSGEKFMFPVADGTVKLSGKVQVLRTSTLIWDRPDRGGEQGNLRENQTDLLQTRFETRRGMMVKLGMISGPFQAISFTVITRNPASNCTCREKNQLKYTDVTRTTETSLDVMLEKNVNDYWNVDGDRELLETWTCFTRFTVLNEKPPTNDLQARHFVARDLERYV